MASALTTTELLEGPRQLLRAFQTISRAVSDLDALTPQPGPCGPGLFTSGRRCRKRRAARGSGQQAQEIRPSHGHTTLCRCVSLARAVQEYRAAPAHRARPQIVVQHHHDVVQAVLAPHAFGRSRIWMPDRAIVVAIARCIAPSIIGPEGTQRQPEPRPRNPVGAIIRANQPEPPDRRRTVALALDRPLSRSAQRAPDAPVSERQPAMGCRCGSAQHTQLRLAVRGFLLNLTPRFHHDAPRHGLSSIFRVGAFLA